MNLPLGPCNIFLDNIDLGVTSKEDDTSLEVKVKTEEIKTDESQEIKEIIELNKEITFKTSLLLNQENFKNLGIDSNLTSLVREGELRIVPLNKTATIFLFKAKIIFELIFNFKDNKLYKIKLKAIALSNEYKKNIEILFGVDVYNQLSVRIRNKNLVFFAPDNEKIPNFKLQDKNLTLSEEEEGITNFKIVNKNLIKILE